MVIVALERVPRKKRLLVRTDVSEPFSVSPDIAARYGLVAGTPLSEARLQEIRQEQAREDAMAAALRIVVYAPRSERELRERLARRGIDSAVVAATVARMKELRLIDDAAFAASWVENRDSSSPRSRRLLAQELRSKGIRQDVASASTEGVDDTRAAYRAGEKRARLLAGRPFEEFRRKVGDLLLRRGFDYETAREAVDRLWQEYSATAERA
jgi:regulatory protein